ncbi:hypothetical protein LMH73_020250 [Vibrio splendidus]|nr:hypothetical protein [Vibrio splendidus]MCC4881881.1 hypothetical protein [Vibrio splendidus]
MNQSEKQSNYLAVITFNADGSIDSILQQSYRKEEAEFLAKKITHIIAEGKSVSIQSTLNIIHTVSMSDGKVHFDTVDTTDFTPTTQASSPVFAESLVLDFCKKIID